MMMFDSETGRVPLLKVWISLPISTEDVRVEVAQSELGSYESGTSAEKIGFGDYKRINNIREDQISILFISVRLTLLNPDFSLSNFDASVGFEIEEGAPMIIG